MRGHTEREAARFDLGDAQQVPSYKSIPVLLSLSTGDCNPSADAYTWHHGDVPNEQTGAAVANAEPQHRRGTGTPV
jgi:hypothetical protein